MADERDTKVQEALQSANIGVDIPNFPSEFREAVEKDAPVTGQSQAANNVSGTPIGASVPINHSEYEEETASELGAFESFHASELKEEDNPEVGASVPVGSAYKEETAAEIATPVPVDRGREREDSGERAVGGAGMGTLALALSILSLFVLPILFGAAGIVLGFVARGRGAAALGAWAIGIGAISIIIGIFILPFF